MHHVHTGEAVVTTQKIDIFWLNTTTRLITHSGQSECFRNCVGEFGMDTGYPLVTSVEFSNCLGHWDIKIHLYVIRMTVLGQGVCLCIRISQTF